MVPRATANTPDQRRFRKTPSRPLAGHRLARCSVLGPESDGRRTTRWTYVAGWSANAWDGPLRLYGHGEPMPPWFESCMVLPTGFSLGCVSSTQNRQASRVRPGEPAGLRTRTRTGTGGQPGVRMPQRESGGPQTRGHIPDLQALRESPTRDSFPGRTYLPARLPPILPPTLPRLV